MSRIFLGAAKIVFIAGAIMWLEGQFRHVSLESIERMCVGLGFMAIGNYLMVRR